MDLSARREAFSGTGRRKRLAEARQASLLRTSELEIPVSIHGDDSEAIALEKANAAAEKAAGLTSKKTKTKTPTRPSPLVLRDEEETEEEENREQGQDVALDDTQTTKTVDHVDPGLSKEADSRPFKRSRLSENLPSLSVDEDISGVKETSDHVASRLQEGFQMPSEDGIFELSKEIASAPALADFDIHSRDPNYSMIGGGIIQRSSDKQQVAEIEEQDVDLSLNYAGLQLCGISSTLFGLRNKCQTLTSELESCDKSRRRAFAEKEKYKKKCLRQEQDLAALNAEKQKVDEAVKAFEQTENELRGEMDALKLGLEEKNRRLEAENAQSATLIAQLKKDVADARAKAEEESMQLYGPHPCNACSGGKL